MDHMMVSHRSILSNITGDKLVIEILFTSTTIDVHITLLVHGYPVDAPIPL